MINSSHLPVIGNHVHIPGIMEIFPASSSKMSLSGKPFQLPVKHHDNEAVTGLRIKI
jgi:hypothetical protein